MKPLFTTFMAIAVFCGLAINSFPQENSGGTPLTTLMGITSKFESKTMAPVDRERLLAEDRQDQHEGKPFRYGTVFEVNFNLKNSGTWVKLNDGSRIWRLEINSPDAISINLFFSDFFIPEGGQFFIYNPEQSTMLGAFTHLNNQQDGYFATAPTLGERAILEYYEPVHREGQGRIGISEVVHGYKDIFDVLEPLELWCNININCPIGAPWVDQKRSVTRITFIQGASSYLCSGSLVNNTLGDRRLYYLTAEHCAPDNHSSMVFYFNYEAPTCTGTGGSLSQTLSGATLRAANYATDFRLVQINGTLPGSYNAYFNGWDRSGNQPTRQTAIHHPGGAHKRISVDTNQAVTSNGFGGRLPGGFWMVTWDYGMTEGGSSGCPLYDQNKRVIGQNLGGTASQCENPQAVQKHFGKFSASWSYGGNPSNQLKDWLDPNNSNVMTLDGINAVEGIAPVANFTSSTQELPISGGRVDFYDLSTNNPASWSWSFPGGTPSSSNLQNPSVEYFTTGAYTVSLTATNQYGSNTKTFVNYIRVAGVPLSAFSLVSPPSGTTLIVGNNDTSRVDFVWQRSSPSNLVTYIFKIKKIGPQSEYTFMSNNNGQDSIISVRRNLLDSIATLMGYAGDSVRCTWRVGATNGLDTLHSNLFTLTLRSTTIGITPISEIIPQHFNLFDNYPNPFNPVTKITFDVPKSQLVRIRVYDIQGREVAVLVNEKVAAGRYKVDFDGTGFASGVYVYTLEGEGYFMAKRMVLIK
jgi:PKD repeat protein